MKLSSLQQESLANWWRYGRHGKHGYDTGCLWESRKATLIALERHGLVAGIRPHYLGGWRADLTEDGERLAEKLASG